MKRDGGRNHAFRLAYAKQQAHADAHYSSITFRKKMLPAGKERRAIGILILALAQSRIACAQFVDRLIACYLAVMAPLRKRTLGQRPIDLYL
jgi:hypothetical protein